MKKEDISTLPEISYIIKYINQQKSKQNPIIDSDNSSYQVPFFKEESYLSNPESYQKFIKGCESMVRKSDRYKAYKKHLIEDIKLDHCQVFPMITTEDANIEMHHGPVFTLYDYCRIIVDWYMLKGMKISTFRIADTVLTEHELDHIQVIMVSESAHNEAQNRGVFLNINQSWGDLNAFINKYIDAIPDDLKEKLNRYIDRSMMSDSDDFDVLSLNPKLWETEYVVDE